MKAPDELRPVLNRFEEVCRPVNKFGQTTEGGHNWKLDEDGSFELWDRDAYPYCQSLHCTECHEVACDKGCDGWDAFLAKCEESDWKNRQGALF